MPVHLSRWSYALSIVLLALSVFLIRGPEPFPEPSTALKLPKMSRMIMGDNSFITSAVPSMGSTSSGYHDLQYWAKHLLPANGGYILHTNLTTRAHRWMDVSMFHQLRCLTTIQQSFLNLSNPELAAAFRSDASRLAVRDLVPSLQPSAAARVAHCFNYLRQVSVKSNDARRTTSPSSTQRSLLHVRNTNIAEQGILCSADTTIQPLNDDFQADGFGLWTECKDSSLLYEWASKSGSLPNIGLHHVSTHA
jgi:hypothetical protein